MLLKLLPIFLTILRLSYERKPAFDNFLHLFTGCTLEIFTSKSYPYDDLRFWISDANLIYPKAVKNIKIYTRLGSEARENMTVKEYLLSKKNILQSMNSKDCCRIGFIDLQESEEMDVANSAKSLLRLMVQNPQPHHVFIRVESLQLPISLCQQKVNLITRYVFWQTKLFLKEPYQANLGNIVKLNRNSLRQLVQGNETGYHFIAECDCFAMTRLVVLEGLFLTSEELLEMPFARGNTIIVLLPKAYFELVFISKDPNISKSVLDSDLASKRESTRRNLDTTLQSRFRNMDNMEVYVEQILTLTKYEIELYYKTCGIYKIRDSPAPLACVLTTLGSKLNFRMVFKLGNSAVGLYYVRVNTGIIRDYDTEEAFLRPIQIITPVGLYRELKTVVFSRKRESNGFALITSFNSQTWLFLFLLLFCLNILLNLAASGNTYPWYVSIILVRYLMDQSVYITKSFRENRNTILRTAIFCCAILAMNVGNLFRGTYTSQLTTKTLPNMRSDLYSLALNSVPIVTTGWEEYNSVNHAQMFRSFLTDEIEKRLIVAVNNSNIYKILQNIKDRTNFLLSSWYDFALNVSNKYPIKTHSGYKSSPDMCVLIDEEIACDSLIKLLNINNAYFPISIRSSGIYTARYVYIASSTLAGRILSPGFNGLRESGILERWSQRNADRALLNPGTFYTNKTYFGTDLHRALIHWPPRKSPEFENDVEFQAAYRHEMGQNSCCAIDFAFGC
ncbi:hypothetical protein Fcan01_19033 [Folsomia candida]|uniref:Uncharacterized protein n=1 Tax=Folsomia candida TaxID=158441 RepID=A0A226DLW4_FOLCA|nr:hypothetical protein Fcan01_19033 [Folsomia candida]